MQNKINLIVLTFFLIVTILVILLLVNDRLFPKTQSLIHKICPPNCNVILISIDTLRADHLGIYGYQKEISPNIDSLAREGVVFKNAFAQSSWTLPSHASMFTGRYPQQIGVEIFSDRLPENSTITEVLRKANYKTAAFTSGTFVNSDHGFSQGFSEFAEFDDWQDANYLTDKAIEWLTINQQEKKFLFLHYFHVHDPYSPREDSVRTLDPKYSGNLTSFNISQIVKLNKGETKLSRTDLNHIKTLYDSEINELDNSLGKFFEQLKKTGLDENTIIIIVGDHGEEFGERGIWAMHAYSLYDELIKIPMIIKIPNLYQGKEVSGLVELVDIPPTILALLGLEDSMEHSGQNLIKVIEEKVSKESVYAETSIQKQQMLESIEKGYTIKKISDLPPQILEGLAKQKNNKIKTRMIRTTNFKLIQNFDNTIELYNLKDDPMEKNNLVKKGLKEELELQNILNNF